MPVVALGGNSSLGEAVLIAAQPSRHWSRKKTKISMLLLLVLLLLLLVFSSFASSFPFRIRAMSTILCRDDEAKERGSVVFEAEDENTHLRREYRSSVDTENIIFDLGSEKLDKTLEYPTKPKVVPKAKMKVHKEPTRRQESHLRLPYALSFGSNAIVVTACVGRHEELKDLSDSNKETYARIHNFDFISGSAEQYPAMTFVQPFAWFKVALLLDVVKTVRVAQTKHEWVLWVDCDSLISNLDQNLVHLANMLIEEQGKRQNEVDVIVAIDEGETEKINSGVMFIRNSQWSLDFFSTVLRKAEQQRLRQHPHWEQAAINELILTKEAWSRQFLKVKRNQINSFQPERDLIRKHPDNRFRKGESFVVHRVNCHNVTFCDALFESWFCHVHSKDERFQRKCQNSKSVAFFDTTK